MQAIVLGEGWRWLPVNADLRALAKAGMLLRQQACEIQRDFLVRACHNQEYLRARHLESNRDILAALHSAGKRPATDCPSCQGGYDENSDTARG